MIEIIILAIVFIFLIKLRKKRKLKNKKIARKNPFDLNSELRNKSAFDFATAEEAIAWISETKEKIDLQHKQYKEILDNKDKDKYNDNDYFDQIKELCVNGTPVPAVFKEFFKMCRKRNIEDKKNKNYAAVIKRIKLMIRLDKKMCEIIYQTTAKYNGVPRKVIFDHYSAITITDRKNLEKCTNLLKQP